MIREDDYLPVGVVTRSHGLKGEVVVDIEPGADQSLGGMPWLWILDEDEPRGLKMLRMQWVGKRLVIRFEGYKKRELGDTLIGKSLWVLPGDLEVADGAVPVQELLGFEVRLEDGSVLGELTDVLRTGANDVYVVRGDRGEWYLPVTEEVVLSLDLAERRALVRLLPGMEPQTEGKRDGR